MKKKDLLRFLFLATEGIQSMLLSIVAVHKVYPSKTHQVMLAYNDMFSVA